MIFSLAKYFSPTNTLSVLLGLIPEMTFPCRLSLANQGAMTSKTNDPDRKHHTPILDSHFCRFTTRYFYCLITHFHRPNVMEPSHQLNTLIYTRATKSKKSSKQFKISPAPVLLFNSHCKNVEYFSIRLQEFAQRICRRLTI